MPSRKLSEKFALEVKLSRVDFCQPPNFFFRGSHLFEGTVIHSAKIFGPEALLSCLSNHGYYSTHKRLHEPDSDYTSHLNRYDD